MILLIAVSCNIVGIPVFAPSAPKQGRFPCEHCSCGCATADYCWDKCCCHSDVEKLAWAAKNDVSPPQFLLERVAQQFRTATNTNPLVAEATSAPKSCCCSNKASLCSTVEPQSDLESTATSAEEPQLRVVRLEDAAKCRGVEMFWSVLSSVVVSWPTPVLKRFDPPLLYTLRLVDDRAISVFSCPDPPAP
ncbi:hypothetical protein [Rosistilla carotiformis]|nr:hypothetical protein [Rosistilla carotiformis]